MDYQFSVVMAVYNTGRYLREAVDDIIRQDIGFGKIQLILVDDGSRDEGGAICDEYAAQYPDNVLVIHQANAGVSAARNAGLEHVKGQYINFMDSDDRISPDAFSKVYSFFEANCVKTDVVSIPLYFFEGRTGPHVLNNKYENGTRVIDLREEWTTVQLHVNSAFIRRECLSQLRFKPQLKISEDAEILQKILLRKQTLGVVAEGSYQYRIRSGGSQSAIQSAWFNPAWYWPRLRYWLEDTVVFCRERLGEIPRFIQYALMYDLRPFFKMREFPADVLTSEEEDRFLDRIYRLLSQLDDEVILAQMDFDMEYKLFLLRKKHGRPPELELAQDGVWLLRDGSRMWADNVPALTVRFLRLREGCFEFDVSLSAPPELEPLVFAEFDGARIPAERLAVDPSSYIFGEVSLCRLDYRASIPLGPVRETKRIRLGIEAQDGSVYPIPEFGFFAPLSLVHKSKYYCSAGRCIQFRDGAFRITPAGSGTRLRKELLYLSELLFSKTHRWKGALYRMLYWLVKPWKRRPLWVISDRRLRAGDNGEAFFRFLREKHREINAVFVLRKSASSYPELKALGKVIENGTLAEKLLVLLSDYILSSQSAIQYYNPLAGSYNQNTGDYKMDGGYTDVFRDLMADRRFVFLQHGVIHTDVSRGNKKVYRNYYGFVTSAYGEYRSLLGCTYGYTERELWLTGLPRFDLLKSAETPRQITVMPTWRVFLRGKMDVRNMSWELPPDFEDSEYCRFFSALLSDERLLETAERFGYTLAFFPHPTYQTHPDAFRVSPRVLLLGLGTNYRSVYEESALIVTDYSSAVFDFAYLKKPVLYAQFDKERFFSGDGYNRGYFDYETDGFGEVEYDLDSTVARMIEYMQSGCVMKEKYVERVDRFFAYHDRNNCQRLFERMTESGLVSGSGPDAS